MWLWNDDLHTLGFRRRSEALWTCEGRHGLPEGWHLSVYAWLRDHPRRTRRRRRRAAPLLVELASFHVTLPLWDEVVHFYYREESHNTWVPEGHTPTHQIQELGGDPPALAQQADAVALRLVSALRGHLRPRGPPRAEVRGARCALSRVLAS